MVSIRQLSSEELISVRIMFSHMMTPATTTYALKSRVRIIKLPPGMAKYEAALQNQNLGDFIMRHKAMAGKEPSDDTGECTEEYKHVLRQTFMNQRLGTIFSHSKNTMGGCLSGGCHE